MDSIFSQPATNEKQNEVSLLLVIVKYSLCCCCQQGGRAAAGKVRAKRSRRTTFQPPLKKRRDHEESPASLPSQSDCRDDNDSGRVCHTVLSYCDEVVEEERGGVVEGSEEVDTQPLSMFSGERRRGSEERSRDLDDLFLDLDDPFSVPSNTQSSRFSILNDTLATLDDPLGKLDDPLTKLDDPLTKLDEPFRKPDNPLTKRDDPLTKLDDPFSVSQELVNSSSESCKSTPEVDSPADESGEEQRVPESPPLPSPSQEGAWPGKGAESEEGQVLRRQFRSAVSSRHYNLHVIPQQFRKTSATGNKGGREGQRSRVNWASRVSVWDMSEGAGPVGGGRERMDVFEVPLSAGEGERGRREKGLPQESRSNLSLSRLDLSHSSRTREEQVTPVQPLLIKGHSEKIYT